MDRAGPYTVTVLRRGGSFRTAVPAGSFEDLAARLVPGRAPTDTGRAPLTLPAPRERPGGRIGRTNRRTHPRWRSAGALVAHVGEEALPAAVGDDLAGLRLPARDPRGVGRS